VFARTKVCLGWEVVGCVELELDVRNLRKVLTFVGKRTDAVS